MTMTEASVDDVIVLTDDVTACMRVTVHVLSCVTLIVSFGLLSLIF